MEAQDFMQIVFVSNYINHHQIPFCEAMCRETGNRFVFIQTEPMEEERVRMGWKKDNDKEYVHCYYEEELFCRKLIQDSDVVLFGGCDDESYIEERLAAGKPIVRISERLYKTGQWKAVSPRGLMKKYHDHTRYRNAPVYLLCAGAYVPSDFHIVRAYPGKMFCWGYFPQTVHYDVDNLLEHKGFPVGDDRIVKNAVEEAEQGIVENTENEAGGKVGNQTEGKAEGTEATEVKKVPYLLWAARFIDWKHPELPLRTAAYLRDKGLAFHMDIVGGGAMEEEVSALFKELKLENVVTLVGYQTPDEVRSRMEKADIVLQTSDRQEGWGAVANEAMNSGCALVTNHMIGASPYLVKQGENGFLYRDGDEAMLFETVEKLVRNPELCRQTGRCAYQTVTEVWNAENAAKRLMDLIDNVVLKNKRVQPARDMRNLFPCAPAPVISERKMWKELTR